MKSLLVLFLFIFTVGLHSPVYSGQTTAGLDVGESDTSEGLLVYFFDLRERETFIQLTNASGASPNIHIQIYDVSNNCNENDFFDSYTASDTHVYNMRDIQTNNGAPSGVVLPDNSYGFVFASALAADGTITTNSYLIGNFRVLDNSGYEYRSNAIGETAVGGDDLGNEQQFGYFNFSTEGGVTLSDIVGVAYDDNTDAGRVFVANVTENFAVFNVDVFDNAENPFSCRDVIYSCVDENSSNLNAVIQTAAENSTGSASVARAEYGINNAIPNTFAGELLCPGNTISEGFVRLEILNNFVSTGNDDEIPDNFVLFVGFNNGNGRGSMDSFILSSMFSLFVQ